MRLDQVLTTLRQLAPEALAEDWDRVGLQLGEAAWAVRKAMLCIDLTEPVAAEAAATKTDLIVAYHPPIFTPLARLTDETWKQRVILDLARRRIALYSPHTALDAAHGGVNDWLCQAVGIGEVTPIRPWRSDGGLKLVTFVPPEHADRLRRALAQAGAGCIGDYEQCSFTSEGHGTFRGGAQTKPTVGERGRLERVAELRVEMLCPAERVAAVVAALRQVHPYEEPAFDLYPLQAPPDEHRGQGRLVTLKTPVSLQTLVNRVKKHLWVKDMRVAAAHRRAIKRVGVCAGAGGALLAGAGQLDLFITGEMRHHDVVAAVAQGTSVILAGHTQTERPYLKVYRKRIMAAMKQSGGARGAGGVDWLISRADRAPLRVV